METRVENLETAVKKLEETAEKAASSEERLNAYYDTMSQMFLEKEKLLLSQMDAMRKHYGKIILSISLVLLLIVGSLIGGLIYLVSNYDFSFQTYQTVTAEGGGDSTIEDGIRFNQYPADREDGEVK